MAVDEKAVMVVALAPSLYCPQRQGHEAISEALYPCKSVLVIVDVGLQGFLEPEWHLSDYRKELTK